MTSRGDETRGEPDEMRGHEALTNLPRVPPHVYRPPRAPYIRSTLDARRERREKGKDKELCENRARGVLQWDESQLLRVFVLILRDAGGGMIIIQRDFPSELFLSREGRESSGFIVSSWSASGILSPHGVSELRICPLYPSFAKEMYIDTLES